MSDSSHLMSGPPRIERPLGLPVSVVRLRRDGARITGDEFRAAEPMIGRLLLGPTNRHQTGGGATHMADLRKPSAAHLGDLCKPLFNPAVERVDDRGFVLSGYEIDVRNGEPVHVEQVWLVRPLTTADPFSG